jgi:hypothetical protein
VTRSEVPTTYRERYQRQGGARAQHLHPGSAAEVLDDQVERCSAEGRGEGGPITFYERYGFEETGEIVFDGEMLLRLKLR